MLYIIQDKAPFTVVIKDKKIQEFSRLLISAFVRIYE